MTGVLKPLCEDLIVCNFFQGDLIMYVFFEGEFFFILISKVG